ncbi:MAG: DUF4114 domain-containing protein [Candidatus Omnitrophota bacterium]
MGKVFGKLSICVVSCVVIMSPVFSYAAFTEPILNNSGAQSLTGAGGILDTLYGLENLRRFDDDLDQLWSHKTENSSVVTAEAKFASYSQTFGYIYGEEGNSFTELFTVGSGNLGYGVSNTAMFSVGDSGDPFRFGNDPSGQYGPGLFSSVETDNPDQADHMLTWYIIGGEKKGNFVVAWEDLLNLGDRDYNDLVVEVSGVRPSAVPEPATILLLGPALLGLLGLKRKKS